MRRLIAILLVILLWLPAGAQTAVNTGNHRKVFPSGGSCTPPTMTYEWVADSLTGTNNCGSSGTSSCTNGAGIYTALELVAGNNGTQTTSLNQPTFTTGAINGLPAFTFVNGSSYWNLATGIPTSTANYTFFAVLKPTGTGNGWFFGVSTVANGLEFGVKYTSPNFYANWGNYNNGSAATDTNAITPSSWVTVAITYVASTRAYVFYQCSAGTCTAHGSGTASSPGTISAAMQQIGARANGSGYVGSIADLGFLSGISTAGIATYSQCKYGI